MDLRLGVHRPSGEKLGGRPQCVRTMRRSGRARTSLGRRIRRDGLRASSCEKTHSPEPGGAILAGREKRLAQVFLSAGAYGSTFQGGFA